MNTRKVGPVALSITLVSLLATMAGCAHQTPAAATPATASHPVVDFVIPADASARPTAPRGSRRTRSEQGPRVRAVIP